jgi:hypothetical protein
MNPAGFDILAIHAGIADVGIGQGHDLTAVAWVGEDLLVSGHRGVEYNLTNRATCRTDSLAEKYRPVGKCK